MPTDLDKQKVNDALEKANGNRSLAAQLLGVDALKLKDFIHNNQDLKLRWAKTRTTPSAPTPEQVAVRQNIVPPAEAPIEPIKTPEEIEAELQKKDEVFSVGISGLGLTQEEAALAKSYHSFAARHAAGMMATVGGCSQHIAVKLTAQASKLIDRANELIDRGEGPRTSPEEGVNECAHLLKAVPAITAEVRKQAELVERAHHNREMRELKKAESTSGKSNGKLGFVPLVAINAQSGATVSVADKSNGDE